MSSQHTKSAVKKPSAGPGPGPVAALPPAPPSEDENEEEDDEEEEEEEESDVDYTFDPAMEKLEQDLMRQMPALVSRIKGILEDKRRTAEKAEDYIGSVLNAYSPSVVTRAFFLLDAILWEELGDWLDESKAHTRAFESLMSEASTCKAMLKRESMEQRMARLYEELERKYPAEPDDAPVAPAKKVPVGAAGKPSTSSSSSEAASKSISSSSAGAASKSTSSSMAEAAGKSTSSSSAGTAKKSTAAKKPKDAGTSSKVPSSKKKAV